jgi:tetratricopeptide (TPR) repeat protein
MSIDDLYIRAKALRMLNRRDEALRSVESALALIGPSETNAPFVAEVMKFRSSLLRETLSPGHDIRIDAAKSLAEYTRTNGLFDDWLFAEAEFLQESLFAAAAHPSNQRNRLQIERAEQALSIAGDGGPGSLHLQAVLVNAYASQAIFSETEDDLAGAISVFETIGPELRRDHKVNILKNILLSWLSLTSRIGELKSITPQIQQLIDEWSLLASEVDTPEEKSAYPSNTAPDTTWIFDVARLYSRFIEAESTPQSAVHQAVHNDLVSLATALRDHCRRNSNETWIVPLLFQAAGHLSILLGMLPQAVDLYRSALSCLDDNAVRHPLRLQILEGLYAVLCSLDPPAAFCEIARKENAAAAWTEIVERSAGDSSGALHEVTQQALLAFETECFGIAQRDGRVSSNRLLKSEEWENARNAANDALVKANLPIFDRAEFPVDVSERISSAATTVILCAGRNSGSALVVPPNAKFEDAFTISLPEYKSRLVDQLTMNRREGWIPALLAWRDRKNQKSFDSSLRRTSVILWDAVFGRVAETLSGLGLFGQVDLVVKGTERLLPWGCSSPSMSMNETVADRTELASGFDLGTLLLGKSRKTRQQTAHLRRSDADLRTSFLVGAPFLGIPVEKAMDLALDPALALELISITDGSGDLPMTRLEGDAAIGAFPLRSILVEGGISPFGAPFVQTLIEHAQSVHIACHGVWMPTHPWTSALMCGPEFALFAATVRARYKMNDSLVFLSACESGIGGPGPAGEGSLLQAFLLAHARCVIPSYWMVHDLSSLIFASALFSALSRGDGIFKSVKTARNLLREMSSAQLRDSLEPLTRQRPIERQAVARRIEDAIRESDAPFDSPIHWGAAFVSQVDR